MGYPDPESALKKGSVAWEEDFMVWTMSTSKNQIACLLNSSFSIVSIGQKKIYASLSVFYNNY